MSSSDAAPALDLTTPEGVTRYTTSLLDPALKKRVADVDLLSGGFSNYVWRVVLAPGAESVEHGEPVPAEGYAAIPPAAATVILKYFAPQLRMNEDFDLPQDRAVHEHSALVAMTAVRGTASTSSAKIPWAVPTPYHFSTTRYALVMEDVGTPEAMLMLEYFKSPRPRDQLAALADAIIAFTHAVPTAGATKDMNPGMTALFDDRLEPSFQRTIAKCEPLGADAQTWADRIEAALKHPRARSGRIFGDLWPNSILLDNADAPTRITVMDWECSRLGHPDQDFTQYLANLVAMRAGARQTPGIFDAEAVDAMIDLLVAAAKPLDETYDHAAMALRYVGYLTWFPHFGVKDAARGIAEAAQELDAMFGKGK
ncbi:Carboxy-terminal domain (CTD) phosphatase [Allomyces javanicus]|nr:Carboxy-terminal domain (CTD) phosphatase [Allomyces javanicus]